MLLFRESQKKNSFFRTTYNRYAKKSTLQSDGRLVKQSQNQSNISFVTPTDDAQRELFRLASFKNCNSAVDPLLLVKAGFYYVGPRDTVACFSCQRLVDHWEIGDDPFSARWHSSTCKHTIGSNSGNIQLGSAASQLGPMSFKTNASNFPQPAANHSIQTPSAPAILTKQSEVQRKPLSSLEHSTHSTNQVDYLPSAHEPVDLSQFHQHASNPVCESQRANGGLLSLEKSKEPPMVLKPHAQSLLDRQANLQAPSNAITHNNITQSIAAASQTESSSLTAQLTESQTTAEAGVQSLEMSIAPHATSVPETPSSSVLIQSTADMDFDDFAPFAPVTASEKRQESMALPESELDVANDHLTKEEKVLLRARHPCQHPFNSDMVCFVKRLSSFESPQFKNRNININGIAIAGFYYLGFSDQVQCWYCGATASDWTSDKDAWVEHAQLFPSCDFLLRNRGSSFVEAALPHQSCNYQASAAAEMDVDPEIDLFLTGRIQSGPDRLPSPMEDLPLSESEQSLVFREAMASDIVQSALRMEFSRHHISQVVRQQISECSCNFQTFEALLETLIATPHELMDFVSDVEQPSSKGTIRRSSLVQKSVSSSRENGQFESNPTSPRLTWPPKKSKRVEKTLEEIRVERRCKICLDNEANVLFRPCAHICACLNCTQSLQNCPICRRKIDIAMPILLP